ncbi:LpxI family protein [uncultured Tateyamaria sp.]|uniref:LpxI family protein n=1 Tax=uncultured Tateyamaria sp. TaxID=455651 RepID=UPI00263A0FB3|nr:UDP-2,3-diacylglucosamine diphosphatase LpxI [uncultured Tateyamaria sp.]
MLALVAGRGGLPAAVVQSLDAAPLVCSLQGNTPDSLSVDVVFRIETLGSFLHDLIDRGVTDVCFCGGVSRPTVDPSLIDARTAPLVPRLAAVLAGGEDSALRVIIDIFEEAGLRVRGAHELAPDLLPRSGVATVARATAGIEMQIELADRVLAEQSEQDLGQACVIRGSDVIAREDTRGTDAMLADLAEPYSGPDIPLDPFQFAVEKVGEALDLAADWLSGPVAEARAQAEGGILFKAPKPGQDRRVDLPTIGPTTAMRAAEAGLDGIVIQAGGVIVLDRPQVVRILDAMGMFLWVR